MEKSEKAYANRANSLDERCEWVAEKWIRPMFKLNGGMGLPMGDITAMLRRSGRTVVRWMEARGEAEWDKKTDMVYLIKGGKEESK